PTPARCRSSPPSRVVAPCSPEPAPAPKRTPRASTATPHQPVLWHSVSIPDSPASKQPNLPPSADPQRPGPRTIQGQTGTTKPPAPGPFTRKSPENNHIHKR